ncbi:FprA family A-type flavoprotein [Candidatus Bathyarchaeota archaeon]|nr:FprA family A-type flavoprotein [Candidatus Bathyarchaeota archaeon]
MVKVSLFYDSKYGNTRLAAEKIAEGIRRKGIEVDLADIKEVRLSGAVCADVLVFGAPNHMASPSRAMKRFVEYLAVADLKATGFAVFGTYAGRTRPVDRAMKKLEAIVQMRMPNLKMVLPGLSLRVSGVRGPMMEGEIDRCIEFGGALADHLRA